jgi:flagellar basal-body rod modification protein FlgD
MSEVGNTLESLKDRLPDVYGSSPRVVTTELDKDAFLKLLVTQMKYQDPLNPTDDKEFISQLAQFTSLEQMKNISEATTQSQAYSLVGSVVDGSFYDRESGAYFDYEQRAITGVSNKGGQIWLTLEGVKDVPLDSVLKVYSDMDTVMMNQLISGMGNSTSVGLIGKTVQAVISKGPDKDSIFIEGIVDYVKADGDGGTLLVVNGEEISLGNVVSISNGNLITGKLIYYSTNNGEEGAGLVKTSGLITGIKIKGDNAYIQVNGEEVKINKINYLTESFALLGKDVNFDGITGSVSRIEMLGGVPQLIVSAGLDEEGNEIEKAISYEKYKGIESEE